MSSEPAASGIEMKSVPPTAAKDEAIITIDQDPKKQEAKKDEKPGEKKEEGPRVPFRQLFRFADGIDKFLIVIGTIGALAHGALMPVFSVVFGKVIDAFNEPADTMMNDISQYCLYFVYIGIGAVVLGYLELATFMVAAERQGERLKVLYLRSILRQDIGWFDVNNPTELPSRLAQETLLMQQAIGEKVGQYLHQMGTFIAAFAVGFTKGWQLTLVMMSVTPLLMVSGAFMGKTLQNLGKRGQAAYAKAGSVAEEVISSVRTVASLRAEQTEVDRYAGNLWDTFRIGVRGGRVTGFGMGVTMFIMFGTYALSFWYGSKLIRDQTTNASTNLPYTGGDVLAVFFAVIMGAFGMGSAAPHMKAFAEGQGAAHRVFELMDRTPPIDSQADTGVQLARVEGRVTFENVHFTYPSRTQTPVLRGLNLDILPSSRIALVGQSGCGKSTVVQLLERFYDPSEGRVLVDGVDVRTFNVRWWRRQVGLVGQEPVLFATTIRENILHGKPGASDAEIEAAARAANAHEFILKLAKGYNTMVGERGGQLSGGQKQRIAIARAIIRNPRLLLLDEATSALDNRSERIVQKALDAVMVDRTTVVIAHRLSTIQNVDRVYVFSGGLVVEQGSYNELLNANGHFSELVRLQQAKAAAEAAEIQRAEDAVDDHDDAVEDVPLDGSEEEESAAGAAGETLNLAVSATPLEAQSYYLERHNSATRDELAKQNAAAQAAAGSRPASASVTQRRPRTSSAGSAGKGKDGAAAAAADDSTGKDKKGKKAKAPKPADIPVPTGRILQMNKPDWPYLLAGVLAAALNGAIWPVFAIVFSQILGIFYKPVDQMQHDADFTAGMFVVIAAACFLSNLVQISSFSYLSEAVTRRLRHLCFKAILRQDIGFFDKEENSTGALTTALASDTTLVNAVISSSAGTLTTTISSMTVGLAIAFARSWKMSLVVLATTPVVAMAGAVQMMFVKGFTASAQEAYKLAGAVANDAIVNARTISAFDMQESVTRLYNTKLDGPRIMGVKNGHTSGFFFGISNATIFCIYALAFWYGGTLIRDGELDFTGMLRCFFAVIMGAMGAGQAAGFAPDMGKAKQAIDRVFKLIDRVPPIDVESTEGLKPIAVTGQIELRDVRFTYPNRPEMTVLNGLTLEARAGEMTALVGHSGCGKSTVIQLLERFYDPTSGGIFLDGINIKEWNLTHLRRQIGLVGQEPVLFNTSIRNNIAYGKPDATEAEIIEAAKLANAHEFIMRNEQAYDTPVGDRGGQLSGGQKQRVAIARAIIGNPRVLLLDEATSALDAESERVVQEALDRAAANRTTLVIAHRLTTIRHAHKIVVLAEGSLVEQGTHDELVARGGAYAELLTGRAASRPHH